MWDKENDYKTVCIQREVQMQVARGAHTCGIHWQNVHCSNSNLITWSGLTWVVQIRGLALPPPAFMIWLEIECQWRLPSDCRTRHQAATSQGPDAANWQRDGGAAAKSHRDCRSGTLRPLSPSWSWSMFNLKSEGCLRSGSESGSSRYDISHQLERRVHCPGAGSGSASGPAVIGLGHSGWGLSSDSPSWLRFNLKSESGLRSQSG